MSASRTVAIIGLFSALYIISAGLVSILFQYSVKGYPEHFLRGILMTIVVVRTGRKWSATTMGVVCGIIFELVVPSPEPYLLASTVASGLVFDLALIGGTYQKSHSLSAIRVVWGSAISGIAESLVALTILTYFGFFGKSVTVMTVAWSIDIVLNVVLSCIGAAIAFHFLRRKMD